MLNRLTMLCSFALVIGCSHSPLGDDSQDGGRLPADGMPPSDGVDASQYQDAAVTPIDGGASLDYAGMPDSSAGDNSDASVAECDSDDDCPEGEDCIDGQCVCDGGEGEFCERHSNNKTQLCHYPPGNPENQRNLCVGTPSVPAHQDHGDTLGVCP